VLASVRDHVQAMPGKPHIRQAFEGWDRGGRMGADQSSPAYLLEVDPDLNASELPDNLPNMPPADWADPDSYCMPESISADGIYQLAAIWQMADRAQAAKWQLYLPVVRR